LDEGLQGEDQTAAIAVLDRSGLLVDDGKRMDDYKRTLAWPASPTQTWRRHHSFSPRLPIR
jgi:hypothetical protein